MNCGFSICSSSFLLRRKALRGKFCGSNSGGAGASVFVLAGLDLAIHAFGCPRQRRGYAGHDVTLSGTEREYDTFGGISPGGPVPSPSDRDPLL
jgi:hypothetical protein